MTRELQNRKVQWLHAHFGTNSATVAALCRQLGGPPFSFTVHGPEEFDRPLSESLGLKIELAGQVVAISSFGLSQLQRWCNYREWSKLKIVRCGLEASSIAPSTTEPIQSNRLVCIARLVEQKGLFCLLEAAKQLSQERIDYTLLLIGDGPLRSDLERLIEASGLTGNIEILGWQSGEAIRRHLQDARCLVLPSYAEGLPVTIMEAFAAGRPVISTYVAGIPELVVPNHNGWLCPAGDPAALVDAIRSCLEASSQDLIRLGEAGKKSVRQMHSIDIEVQKLAQHLNEACGELSCQREVQSSLPVR